MVRMHCTWRRRIIDTLILGGALFAVLNLSVRTASAFGGSDNFFGLRQNHPGVGAWFGKAVEVCLPGNNPQVDCAGLGFPAVTIFMTPSFYADGNFLGNDSLALGTAPFGPHTTAHGEWVPTSRNQFVADIVFLLNPFPPPALPSTGAVHIKYAATVINPLTMVGYVNIYFFPPLELSWEQLSADQFPTLPGLVYGIAAPPPKVFTDQAQCPNVGLCPLVFKFKVTRVAP